MRVRPLLPLLFAGAAAAQEAPHLARTMPRAGRVTVAEAVRTAVDFLVEHQNPDGSFGRHTVGRWYEVSADVPGGHQAFRAATTALCWMGLQAAPHQPPRSAEARSRALAWLVRGARVKRASGGELYNTWSFYYGLQALSRALRDKAAGASEAELRAAAQELVRALGVYQTPDGGWAYYDFQTQAYKPSWSTSFTTATALVALHEAKEAGLEVPAPMLDRAMKLMPRFRTPDGHYLYSIDWRYRPAGLINRAAGSSLRTQACNLAQRLHGAAVSDDELRKGLEDLVEQHRFAVAGVRRPIPHESWYFVSGYFYLYGHLYAAMELQLLSRADHERFWPHVARSILKCRQPDGSFWDYPLYGYHKFYGTGYALMALSLCPG
ncbi:MAG: hypothetical protein ACREID_07820, partial [Planctomycetota bacterium]